MRRVIVTGGRDYNGWHTVVFMLRQLPADAVVVHGAASGADALAEEFWAGRQERATEKHPADWTAPCRPACMPGHRRWRRDGSDYCPAAGNYRNQEMADAGADACLAFPGGTGTADMVRRAKAAGIRVIDVGPQLVRVGDTSEEGPA